MKTSLLMIMGLGWAASGCMSAEQAGDGEIGAQAEASGKTEYLLIGDFNESQYQDAWFDIQSKLNQEFADVCGDTFCAGDYSNLTPLTVSCSVSSKIGTVHDCAWTFAGSLEAVSPTTATIGIDAPTFQCRFHPVTTTPHFVTLLSGSSDAIHETLPGTTGSIYDELVDCFQHPIGSTPVTFVNTPSPTYVEASDYYTSPTYQAKWQSAKAALDLGFNNICGDTFCSSDYADLQSMAFVCSVTKSSGNLKSCDWVFGGSYPFVLASGVLQETSASWKCPVPVRGTLSQLITTLTATDRTSAIDRLLPGTTASAYDALAGCLP